MKRSKNHQNSNIYSIRVVERAIQLLDCFSFQQKEHTMGELSELTNLSKSTVFRILQTLEKHKFIAYDPLSNRYSLGIKLFELGGVVFSSFSLRKAASRFLDHLEAKVNHTVLMGILEDGELVYIDKREGNEPIKLTSEIGKRRPPHFGMVGKTLMSYLSEIEVDNLLKKYPLEKVAPNSIIDIKKFKKSLNEIREKGYTYEYSEAVEGVIGIGAPIRNHLRKVVAAVGIAFSAFSANDQKIEGTINLVTETAKNISEALGFIETSKNSGGKAGNLKIRS
jgi:DNA-binding IclR family transcriptional regulator